MPPKKRSSRKTNPGSKPKVTVSRSKKSPKAKISAKKPVRKTSAKKSVVKRHSSISYMKKYLEGVRVFKKAGAMMDRFWNDHPNLTKGQRTFIFNTLDVLMNLQGINSITEKNMKAAIEIFENTRGLRASKK